MTTDALPLLSGPNVLIMGPTGVGKTYSIGTLVDSGVDVFYLAMESGMESLLGYWTDRGLPIPPNLHWHRIARSNAMTFEVLKKNAEIINTMSADSLGKYVDPNKRKYNQHILLLEALNNFTDDRTGERFGSVDEWPAERFLVIDALTGLNSAAMSLVVGGSPVKSLPDWGKAQDQLEQFLRMLCDGCRCGFVLLAHVEMEPDPISGRRKISIGTLGQKLAPKIPIMFSDVILAERNGTAFNWNTAHVDADLKTRNLPLAEKIKPDFKQIIDKWNSRAKGAAPAASKLIDAMPMGERK